MVQTDNENGFKITLNPKYFQNIYKKLKTSWYIFTSQLPFLSIFPLQHIQKNKICDIFQFFVYRCSTPSKMPAVEFIFKIAIKQLRSKASKHSIVVDKCQALHTNSIGLKQTESILQPGQCRLCLGLDFSAVSGIYTQRIIKGL